MAGRRIRAVLTDIEGTTSSIAFVTDTLFPYARARLADYVARHADAVAPLIAQVPGDAVETLTGWIDADRKEPVLKQLQGMIWAEGYADGALVGHVYPDAADALRRWHGEGLRLFVYSSGSVAAQKLIFGHSSAGDLTPLFSGWFDLSSGSKLEAASYAGIAAAIGEPAAAILFLSDNPAEIAAADAAGMATVQVAREGGSGVASFAEIAP
ncbi:MAG: 2,3-diketo-5-methylthio-1-phosphopentane phosphatase [Sphingomonas sp. SCN 67-18]|uniref:acireductone synthase n=1 Tax=uncultured Sphingomonas sp. TaxID=158754 RepID=UPI00086CC029|nr:acireductone synthase [Sphingomonas sp. SCN 67-18]ODU20964.1 MAG: 2,3-diketo-5-methylthio-1-phosphopentane phosphatase [Sphingomonas sp. SCN 67-18]